MKTAAIASLFMFASLPLAAQSDIPQPGLLQIVIEIRQKGSDAEATRRVAKMHAFSARDLATCTEQAKRDEAELRKRWGDREVHITCDWSHD